MKRYLFVAVLVLLTVSRDVAREKPGSAPRRDSLKVGDDAPTFVLIEAVSDEAVFLRDFTGRALRNPWKNKEHHVVVLSFWATWCEPCKEEIPLLTKIAAEFSDTPVKFFLINTGEPPNFTRDSLLTVLKRRGYRLPTLMDNTGSVAKRYTVQALPVLVVLDKSGVVRKINWGYHQDFDVELRTLLRELLQEPSPQ